MRFLLSWCNGKRPHYLVFILALVFSSPVKAKELVFILAGQSNMVGQGKTEELASHYLRDPHNVSFYYNGYQTSLSRFSHFGPEISFAHEVSRRFPNKKIKLIKFAVGGTSMFAWHPQWSAERAARTNNISSGALFEKLIKTARIPFDEEKSILAGILWMQGETDAKYPVAANMYIQNLVTFVDELRFQLNAPKAPFILGNINPPEELFPFGDVVRYSQSLIPSIVHDCRLVKTDGLGKRSDLLHYNTLGQVELGKRFAREYLKQPILAL